MFWGLYGGEGVGMGGFGINLVDVYDCYIKEFMFENIVVEWFFEFKFWEEDWVLVVEKFVVINIFLEILYVWIFRSDFVVVNVVECLLFWMGVFLDKLKIEKLIKFVLGNGFCYGFVFM